MNTPSSNKRMLRIGDVCEMLGVSKTTIYNWTEDGFFPKPIVLGPVGLKTSTIRWPEEEVEAWLASRPRGRPND